MRNSRCIYGYTPHNQVWKKVFQYPLLRDSFIKVSDKSPEGKYPRFRVRQGTLLPCDNANSPGGFSRRKKNSKKGCEWWIYLVVSTPLKNISQNGNLPQIGVKIKKNWNHHPVDFGTCRRYFFEMLKGKPSAVIPWSLVEMLANMAIYQPTTMTNIDRFYGIHQVN